MDDGKSPPPQQQQALVAVIGILALVFVVAGFLVYRVSRASGRQKAQVAQVGLQRLTLVATLLVSEAPFVLMYSHIRLSIPFRQGPCSNDKRETPSQWCQDVASSLLQWPLCKTLLWLTEMQELRAPGATRKTPQRTTAN